MNFKSCVLCLQLNNLDGIDLDGIDLDGIDLDGIDLNSSLFHFDG